MAVLDWFNYSCSPEGSFSRLVVTTFSGWIFRSSNGFLLVTQADALGMIIEG
jgi:hypothetical protein